MHNKRKLFPVLLLIILAIAFGIWQNTQSGIIQGKVEQVVVPHYSEVSGKISKLYVQQGQTVQAGDVLAVLDSAAQENAIQQLQQTLIQQQASLEQTMNGAEPAAIKQAQSAVKAAQANYNTARLQYENLTAKLEKAAALYEIGGISKQDYDSIAQQVQTAQNAVTAAEAQVESAQQQVVLLSGGADTAAVRKAQAAVAQTELQIAQAEDTLEKYTIRASCSGTVISVNYTAGALAAAGSDLAEITDEAQTYVLAYVSEETLASIAYGDVLQIEIDGTEYPGTVSFIDVEAVYTPKEFQTVMQQNQEEFRIKLNVEDDLPARPGQMVKVHLNSN